MSDYNRRQIQFILNHIESFETNEISISELIGSLEYLLSNIENGENMTAFWQEWGRLEEYYSVCIVEKNGICDLNNMEITDAITNLKRLSKNWIVTYLSLEDKSVQYTANVIENNWFICPICEEIAEYAPTFCMIICPKCNNALHNPQLNR